MRLIECREMLRYSSEEFFRMNGNNYRKVITRIISLLIVVSANRPSFNLPYKGMQ